MKETGHRVSVMLMLISNCKFHVYCIPQQFRKERKRERVHVKKNWKMKDTKLWSFFVLLPFTIFICILLCKVNIIDFQIASVSLHIHIRVRANSCMYIYVYKGCNKIIQKFRNGFLVCRKENKRNRLYRWKSGNA